jgi:hypothetical protein
LAPIAGALVAIAGTMTAIDANVIAIAGTMTNECGMIHHRTHGR